MTLAEPGARSRQPNIGTCGISHVVLEVGDAGRAHAFYTDVLGLVADSGAARPEGNALGLACVSGQRVVLVPTRRPRTFPQTGVHQAYTASLPAIDRIVGNLTSSGVEVHRYREDRPAEESDNIYFSDPDGNRIQLVHCDNGGEGVVGIDHAAVQVSDIEWAEEFYVETLGLPVVHRVGWNTGDYVRARAWAEGREDMAPGTRRWDQRYRAIPGRPDQSRRVPRANMQVYLEMGTGIFGIYLALSHEQEPAPHLACGTPRTAFAVDRPMLECWADALASSTVPVDGPVEHAAEVPLEASLYFRDPCGNFIELAVPRKEGQSL